MREPEIAAGLAAEAKIVLTGDAFVADILSLVARLREDGGSGRWRAVVGVLRGGVFPAQRVAEALGLDYREIQVSYYQGASRTAEPRIVQTLPDDREGEGLLIVDDVVDSGGTALCVRRMLPRCDLAAVYTKPAGRQALAAEGGSPPVCGREMDDRWIVFPWDHPDWDELSPQLVAKYRAKLTE